MFVSLRPLSTRPVCQRYAGLCSKAVICPSARVLAAPQHLQAASRGPAHSTVAPIATMTTTEDPRKKHFWTTKDMPDQSGKTVIVTGAASGMGWYCAKASPSVCCSSMGVWG
jgi:NADPH:quinone reductase-like Zn-dependent oxidoreductase